MSGLTFSTDDTRKPTLRPAVFTDKTIRWIMSNATHVQSPKSKHKLLRSENLIKSIFSSLQANVRHMKYVYPCVSHDLHKDSVMTIIYFKCHRNSMNWFDALQLKPDCHFTEVLTHLQHFLTLSRSQRETLLLPTSERSLLQLQTKFWLINLTDSVDILPALFVMKTGDASSKLSLYSPAIKRHETNNLHIQHKSRRQPNGMLQQRK